MKFQPKRFVVEVKRGTSRAAFASPDPSTDRFSSAEAVLFGGASKVEPAMVQPKTTKQEVPGRRILRSLVEPPPPVMEDLPAPVRRGRKPGSKNKPKVHSGEVPAPSAASEVAPERPRRGRKPGSKNKPKAPLATSFLPILSANEYSAVAAMRSYGFTDDGTAWEAPSDTQPTEPSPPSPAPIPRGEPEGDAAPKIGRTRLRDRSSILKRYVLDLEPRPGQPGALRARRLSRAALR